MDKKHVLVWTLPYRSSKFEVHLYIMNKASIYLVPICNVHCLNLSTENTIQIYFYGLYNLQELA